MGFPSLDTTAGAQVLEDVCAGTDLLIGGWAGLVELTAFFCVEAVAFFGAGAPGLAGEAAGFGCTDPALDGAASGLAAVLSARQPLAQMQQITQLITKESASLNFID
jgi:hypothetical protein